MGQEFIGKLSLEDIVKLLLEDKTKQLQEQEDKAKQLQEQEDKGKPMQEQMEKQMGEIICSRNPYPKDRQKAQEAHSIRRPKEPFIHMALVGDVESQIEEDSYQAGYWKFKDRSLRIAKAIRFPYTYIDENGNQVKEYVLIGYEGSGGDA
jgi:hypothetical protein